MMEKNINNIKKEKGITLIALIITIIVLVILAGIAIGALTSNNSVLKQAGSAKKETLESEEVEKVNIAVMDAAANAGTTVTGELTTELVKNAIKGQFGDDAIAKVKGEGPWKYDGEYKTYKIDKTGKIEEANARIVKDSNDVEYPLPRDAKYEKGTVDTGLVISYKGSEFVWIPVDKETLYAKGTTKKMADELEEEDDKGRTKYKGVLYDDDLNNITTLYKEPVDLQNGTIGDWGTEENKGFELIIRYIDEFKGLENNSTTQALIKTKWIKQLQEEYDAMIESVKEYGGFYVGRYETSIDIKSVANVMPIEASTEIDGYIQTWYGLYQRQKYFTSSSDSMVSGMIWGSQWDAMLNWIKDSGTENAEYATLNGHAFHNYTQTQKTGAEARDVMNNIYDLEGNMREWTLSAKVNNRRIVRGGNDGNGARASTHADGFPAENYAFFGSRMALYIKM